MDYRSYIENGNAVLGIEFGSTRIKAVLIGEKNEPIAVGTHDWENQLENHIWTYSLDTRICSLMLKRNMAAELQSLQHLVSVR